MIYSGKTLILSALLFLLSMLTLGSMYIPLFGGHNGFDAMESTFNSLRKGISPPFDKLTQQNKGNLGKSITADLTFSTNEITEVATRILLRNKMMVTPSGRTLRIQGDLGYTLQYFLRDIWMLYFNRNDALEKKYSMSATQSMFVVDRILKHLAFSLASQKMTDQENLTKAIRSEVLVPAYNLRKAPPINETSGITYLALGTLTLLLIATLWDLANLLFFRTITDSAFLIRISGREKKEKLAAAKKLAELKKKAAKTSGAPADKKTKVPTKTASPQKKMKPQTTDIPTQAKQKTTSTKPAVKTAISKDAIKKSSQPTDTQVKAKKRIVPASKPETAGKAAAAISPKTAPAANSRPTKKPESSAVTQKNSSTATSQNLNKKVTAQPENKKENVKVAVAKPKTKPEAPAKAPAPKTAKIKE
ncbi:hypothetical protein [Desulfovibrio gilichinskyi]|uniref:Uncharacterized protein n=1 Tax=Desulfovibrio gilichinskyi TaxID=1519643 RepID=A0A1X7D212_9BACT|nr:hypothetical protein [Desulfovibrio gilichinskyi]SMF07292.1 hypothetical protein SAMN06295933_1551 [Desulfovibrio gilichinskyi]